jgi:transcriptional regulator with XRE-family HTH domain
MNITKYRRIAGLTQRALADLCGLDTAVIARLEDDPSSASPFDLKRLAKAFNVTPGVFRAPPKTLDAKLKTYRAIANLSQRQLAHKSGVDVSIICRLELGERKDREGRIRGRLSASYENVVRLARALNLEPEELLAVPSAPAPPAAEARTTS